MQHLARCSKSLVKLILSGAATGTAIADSLSRDPVGEVSKIFREIRDDNSHGQLGKEDVVTLRSTL